MQTNRFYLFISVLCTAFVLLAIPPMAAQDKQPEYPGGMPALVDFMVKNLKYPEAAKKENAEGVVIVKFKVGKDGSLTGIKTVSEGSQNPREDFVREAVRVIRMMPQWTPAEDQGKIVEVEMALPVQFRLGQEKKP